MISVLIALACATSAQEELDIDWSHYVRNSKPAIYNIDGERWTFRLHKNKIDNVCFAYVEKGGEVVVTMEGYGGDVCYRRCWFPTPWPVFLVGWHTANGHGQQIDYYAIQDGVAKRLLSVQGECGGPVFRDFDDDGVMEWVFDDDEWYTYIGHGPQRFLVYRVNDSGGLDLWKTVANRGRTRLPTPMFDWF